MVNLELLKNSCWQDKNNLKCIILNVTLKSVLFKFLDSSIKCSLPQKEFLDRFKRDLIQNSCKYSKTTQIKVYNRNMSVDKSKIVVSKTVEQLTKLIQDSGFTVKEVADKLGWSENKLSNILSGNRGLSIHSLTHISGVLGYTFEIIFKKEN